MKWFNLLGFSFVVALVLFLVYKIFFSIVNKKEVQNKNVQAFLKMIRYAEGTAGANGYKTMFTGALFTSYASHPNVMNCATVRGVQVCSTAAGAYQFLFKTWESLRKKLNLKDFSPESQDLAAVQLIYEKNALADVEKGNFEAAIKKVSKIWASLPGAGYNQPEKQLAELKNIYLQNGGTTTT